MPKRIMPLTDVKIAKAKPQKKPQTMFDGDGLYLLITPTGGKLWRIKYRFEGKEKLLALGAYPAISLAEARERRAIARKQIVNGIDPAAVKKAQKQAGTEDSTTFEVVAREWHTKFSPSWAISHADTTISRMERDLFPWIGERPISEIKAPELLSALRRVESRGALESARRVKIIAGQVFRYAVATGRAERDPSNDLRGALATPMGKHHAAIIDPNEVAPLLRALEGYKGSFVVKCALKLAPLFFVRPGELRHAEWTEVLLEEAIWTIPSEKMKMRQAHIVPLCSQAVAILTELKELTGGGEYVFPSGRSSTRPMSENAILAALRNMGYDKNTMTGHGFRAMARTLLHEVLDYQPDVIEAQLAHSVPDRLGTAYNRTQFIVKRKQMMQQWADYLDGLKQGAEVILSRQTTKS